MRPKNLGGCHTDNCRMGFMDRLRQQLPAAAETGERLIFALRSRVLPDIWTQPVAGRKIVAVEGVTTVRGYQTAEGLAIVTIVEQLQRHPQPTASAAIKELHYQFVSEAREEATGEYTWTGRTPPAEPSYYLSGILGHAVGNLWREETHSWDR